MLNGETVRLELEIDYRTIGNRWVNAVYTPTFGSDGKPNGWVGVVVDIDEQKRSEEALRVTDKRKDRFLAKVERIRRSEADSPRALGKQSDTELPLRAGVRPKTKLYPAKQVSIIIS